MVRRCPLTEACPVRVATALEGPSAVNRGKEPPVRRGGRMHGPKSLVPAISAR